MKTMPIENAPRWAIGITLDSGGANASAVKWVWRDSQWVVENWQSGSAGQIVVWVSRVGAATEGGQIVVGLDSAAMRFLRLTLPPAADGQLPALAAAQAEARLPIERSQLALACAFEHTASAVETVAAAARRQTVDAAMARWPQAILAPDAAGLWHLAAQVEPTIAPEAVILLARADETLVCRFEKRRLVDVALISYDSATVAAAEFNAALAPFVAKDQPIYGIGGRDAPLAKITDALVQSGWQVKTLEIGRFLPAELAADSRAAVAAGLALAAAAGDIALNFADARRQTQAAGGGLSAWRRWAMPAAITAALAAACAMMAQARQSAEIAAMRRQLAVQKQGITAGQAVEKMQFAQLLSRRRPDALGLLAAIQDSRGELLLDALEWEAGKPARITASAGSYAQVWEFQSRLQQMAGVRNARLTDAKMDEKNSQVRFTIQFDYSGMISR